MLRNVLATAVLGLCVLFAPAYAEEQASANPGGTWGWSYDYGQGEIKSSVTLQVKDNVVTGVFHGQDGGKIDIKEGTFDGKTVTFQFDVTHDGRTITAKFTGVPTEDAIDGSLSALVDGETHEFPWKAARATRPEDVVGHWKLTIKTTERTFEPEIKLEQAGSKLTGRYLSKEIGEHDLETVTLTDNVLKFSASISRDGHTLKLNYEGKPRGDQLAGEISYDIDGNTGSSKFTGNLTPPKAE